MIKPETEIETRVPDEGQWFEPGVRVDRFRSTCAGWSDIVPAVLGTYEVQGCAREHQDGRTWLVVRLRRFGL